MSDQFSKLLLDWFSLYGRDLPWRHKGGAHKDPYIVLVSELMLQQTTVKTVLSYFDKFIKHFPNIESLAAASQEEVNLYWQGLGYYARARSLHKSAEIIMSEFKGKFPSKKEDVLKLKGLGPYTISSFLALAFNAPETVVDGNVIRIISRLYHFKELSDDIMLKIREKAEALTDKTHPADYASAIMDLGATICTPKKPNCSVCPVKSFCKSKDLPDLERIPARKKMAKKEINGFVYIITNRQNEILIRKRTEKGLLFGLFEFPWSVTSLFDNAIDTGTYVSHVFTHINMTLKIYKIQSENTFENGFFIPQTDINKYAFSTLMKKVIKKVGLN